MCNRRLKSFGAAALLAAFAVGCGGDKGLPPATSTQEADQAQMKAGMEKSYEMMKKQGHRMRGKPPGAG